MNKWIKVTDRLPDPSRAVMFWDDHYKSIEFGYYELRHDEWLCITGQLHLRLSRITHWMDAEAPS